jgi:hypothetical protein
MLDYQRWGSRLTEHGPDRVGSDAALDIAFPNHAGLKL